jgi:hypothetical protein
MTLRFAKVSEIAERFRVSPDAVYLWIREGRIPSDCVVRIAGTVRVDEEQFERRLRAGTLCGTRGRKRTVAAAPMTFDPLSARVTDNLVGSGPTGEHAWTEKASAVECEHRSSSKMRKAER